MQATLKCLFSVCIFASVSGIRVPSDVRQIENVGNNQRLNQEVAWMDRSDQISSLPIMLHYNPLPSTNLFPEPKQKLLSQGEIFIFKGNIPEVQPTSPNLPPLTNPRYPTNQEQQRLNENYQNLPSDVLRISANNNNGFDKYKQLKDRQIKQQNMLNKLVQAKVYKEYPKIPSASLFNTYVPRREPQYPPQQAHKFIVAAEEDQSTLNPLGYQLLKESEDEVAAKKEPMFFVTEGYRNVLVQGANKKKKYVGDHHQQHKDESMRVLNKQKVDVEDEKKAPIKRKVTKVYKIVEDVDDGRRNGGGIAKNSVEAQWEKPKRYFERPQGEDRGFKQQLITNYRDDTLYEPSDDKDDEKEETDDEREETDDEKISEKEVKEDKSTKDEQEDENAADSKEEIEDENEAEDYDEEDEETNKEVPQSEHADPKPVPTKPIYPGEGQWAKPGIKHRPHISQHIFLKPVPEQEQKPDGYQVFEELGHYFEHQKDKFGDNFGAKIEQPVTSVPRTPLTTYIHAVRNPNPVSPIVVYDPFTEPSNNQKQLYKAPSNTIAPGSIPNNHKIETSDSSEAEAKEEEEIADDAEEENYEDDESDEAEEEEVADDFVPLRLYTQVRKSENVEHEPYDPLEHGRLREVIRDSKVQTVYTEEGYEDNAYDHAGHEKKAEQDQGYSEFEREKQEKGKPKLSSDSDSGHSKKIPIAVDKTSQVLEDSVASDSVYPSHPNQNHIIVVPKSGNSNNFISTEEVKTTQVKDKNNGDLQLEIQSEVKVIMQPNNSTKAHKYVKIYPKVLKDIVREQPATTTIESTISESIATTTTEAALEAIVNQSKTIDEEIKETSKQISSSIYQEINNLAARDESTTESSTVSNIEAMTKRQVDDNKEALKKYTNNQFANIARSKRSSGSGFEDVHIDTEFINKINHTFGPPAPEIDVEKYPYYTMPELNEDSPLRYAENMDNIPVKKGGELSFYKMADRNECPDIPQNIDPIPEHVKNADARKGESEEEGKEESDEDDESNNGDTDANEEEGESEVDKKQPPTPKLPRIQLGDKIDCLKTRYFGENPLDSPFFKEETVGPVKPIFQELTKNSHQPRTVANFDSAFKPSAIFETNEIFNKKDKKDERKFESEVKDKIFNTLNNSPKNVENEKAESIRTSTKILGPTPTPVPLVSLITTPKYTIQLTPNNIYDQIKLLDHLPEQDVTESATNRVNKKLEVVITTSTSSTTTTTTEKAVVATTIQEDSTSREPKVLLDESDGEGETQTALEPEALRRRRVRPRKPIYQIFDVNRYLTTTPFSVINTASTTVLPKHKVISEVFYKDEIKPDEQLNVFADILNNIKNSSQIESVPIQSASDFAEPNAVTISTLQNPDEPLANNQRLRVKKFHQSASSDTNLQNNYEEVKASSKHPSLSREKLAESYNTYKTINRPKPVGGLINNKMRATTDSSEISTPATRKILKRRRKPTTTTTTFRTTTTTNIQEQNNNHQPYVIDFLEDDEQVVGLVPPQSFQYRTIVVNDDLQVRDSIVPDQIPMQKYDKEVNVRRQPAPVTEMHDEMPPGRSLNNYYFFGLRPPFQQRVRPYSEFINNNILVNDNLLKRRVAHIGLSRAKRSAARPAYADVSRNRGKQTEGLEDSTPKDDDIDDYVPHRPKNYHYDEKTGKIVYHSNPTEKTPLEEDVEYEEIEVPDTRGIYLERAEDTTHPTPQKVTTKELLATASPPPEGHGLLDFVIKLKNNPNYKYIPDPTTPKPGETTEAFVTPDPKSTDPPEFLSILSKVKSDKIYKYIDDPKESASQPKSKSTTPDPEEYEDDEEEEDDDDDGQPGLSHYRPIRQVGLGVFNVGSFLPRIQTPVSSDIPTNFFQKYVVEKLFPRLRYMTLYDIARERYKQTDLYKFIKKHVQNAPGGQNQDLGNIQIFDIGDYLPKIKPVTPKTPVDYSKYKTIERPHVKPNTEVTVKAGDDNDKEEVASRPPFNPGGQPVSEEEALVKKPVAMEETVDAPMEVVPSTTTQKIVQFRRGTRPSTQRTTTVTEPPTTRRSANRRRPVPSGFRTTRRPTEVTETTEKVERIYPENYSTEKAYSDTNDKAKRVYRRRPIRIRYTTERQAEDDKSVDKIVRRSLDSDIEDVRNEFHRELLEEPNVEDTYEDIKEEITDDDDEDRVEITDRDASETSHREVVKESPKDVEVIDENYDKSQKHGGNYRKEEVPDELVDGLSSIEDNDSQRKASEDSSSSNTKKNVEIVNKEYDKTQKHGGNYREPPEEEDSDAAEDDIDDKTQFATTNKANNNQKEQDKGRNLDAVIINQQYDQTKKHGGNYKSEQDAVVDELLEGKEALKTVSHLQKQLETTPKRKRRIRLRPTSTTTESSPARLSDIVPKPDHFYTDPKLAAEVNQLRLASIVPSSQDIAEVVAQGDAEEETTEELRRRIQLRRRTFEDEDVDDADEQRELSTKKPIFIKDPSKRLYFYAPL